MGGADAHGDGIDRRSIRIMSGSGWEWTISLGETREPEREFRRRVERAFRTAPFSLYTLGSSWSGPRRLGGCELAGDLTVALSILHGRSTDYAPSVLVETAIPSRSEGGSWMRCVADELWSSGAAIRWVDLRTYPGMGSVRLVRGPRSIDDLAREYPELATLREPPRQTSAALTVDGVERDAALIRLDDNWIARLQLDSRVLTVEARGVPSDAVDLVRVTDIEPFIEAWRQFAREMGWSD